MSRFAPITLMLLLLAPGFGCEKPKKPTATKLPAKSLPTAGVRWKGVLMTGDDSITAFDNARKKLREIFVERGVAAKDIRELSMQAKEQNSVVKPSSDRNFEAALRSLKVKDGDGCFVYLTSHGAPYGFYMRDQPEISPARLDKLLDRYCGKRPTAVFVSACYSGVFTGSVMRKPHRAVFAAARDDRNSFGCGVEDYYTFWDNCVIDLLPTAATWTTLKTDVATCIREKEQETKLRFSYPQGSIGTEVAKLRLFGKGKKK